MSRTFISVRIEDDVLKEARAIAERNRWKFQAAVDIAMAEFVQKYRTLQFPGLENESRLVRSLPGFIPNPPAKTSQLEAAPTNYEYLGTGPGDEI